MSEWKEYIGSDEQIAEIASATSGILIRNRYKEEAPNIWKIDDEWGVPLSHLKNLDIKFNIILAWPLCNNWLIAGSFESVPEFSKGLCQLKLISKLPSVNGAATAKLGLSALPFSSTAYNFAIKC